MIELAKVMRFSGLKRYSYYNKKKVGFLFKKESIICDIYYKNIEEQTKMFRDWGRKR